MAANEETAAELERLSDERHELMLEIEDAHNFIYDLEHSIFYIDERIKEIVNAID